MNRDLLTLDDLTKEDIVDLINTSLKLKYERYNNIEFNHLSGKTLGLIFDQPSTRTRVSFETGIYQLGGQALFLSGSDLQLGHGETYEDTAKVLSGYLDAIVFRTKNHQNLVNFAKYSSVPVINGMTDISHPCQVLADLMTVYEIKGDIVPLKYAYIGKPGNMLYTYSSACSIIGAEFIYSAPEKIDCKNEYYPDPKKAVSEADVIITDSWGEDEIDTAYTLSDSLITENEKDKTVLHKLPARKGIEISKKVFDAHSKEIFGSSDNRLHIQKALLLALL